MKNRLLKLAYIFGILATIMLGLYLLRFIKIYNIFCTLVNICTPILFGFVFAWILNPLYKRLNKKLDKRISIVILIIIFIAIYLLVGYILLPLIVNKIGKIVNIIKSYIPKVKKIPFLKFDDNILKMDTEAFIASCGGIINIIVNIALVHMFGFYILYNYDTIRQYTKKCIPKKYKELILKFTKKLSLNMYLFVKGTLIDALVLFAITALAFSIIGLKYSLLIAVFIALTNIIPFIGPYIGGIPAVIVGISMSTKFGIITLLIVVVAQLIESNIINPLIMSKCIKINPFLIVIAITIMGRFLGILGMALATPILIFLKILIEYISKCKKEIQSVLS